MRAVRGHFHSEPSDPPPPDTHSYQHLAEALDRPVNLSKPIVDQIFSTARSEKFFTVPCEDNKHKVAFQGTKELSYQGPDGKGTCSYNWSKFDAVQKLTTVFESIAFTLEEGRRLAVEHKHDRLALDAELSNLMTALKEGRAIEVQSIQPSSTGDCRGRCSDGSGETAGKEAFELGKHDSVFAVTQSCRLAILLGNSESSESSPTYCTKA